MKIRKPIALVTSILICQLAGIIGAFFTTSAIPTWYITLIKPSFNPPSWIFGPVWTILYTLMGIAVYKIWLKNPGPGRSFALKVFGVHLVLNSAWSIIFFGLKNPGFAFIEIVILWVLIIYIIKLFWKIEKIAAILLIPYLAWVSFATVLNLSIWTLNSKPIDTFAQDFNYNQAYSDYSYTKDKYGDALTDFNKKKDSYLKNPTLSLKEEARLSLFEFLYLRNDLITTYLTTLRMRILESSGLTEGEKNTSVSKITKEYDWFKDHKNKFLKEDTIEKLIEESGVEDSRFMQSSKPSINYSLTSISLGDVVTQYDNHKKIYDSLKKEAGNLVNLGRADSSLFERWFLDIEGEHKKLDTYINTVKSSFQELEASEDYVQKRAFKNANESFEPIRSSLLETNRFLYELENVIESKR